MSLRSLNSTAPSTNQQHTIADESVYQYALRVAFLAWLCTPKAATQRTDAQQTRLQRSSTDVSSWSLTFGSLSEIFDRRSGNAGEITFPKEFVKVFGARLEGIVRGTDAKPANRDELFRACAGHFYGKFHDPPFQRQIKANRKIEELIIMFVTSASKVLKDRFQGSDEWKTGLMRHVATLVRVISDCMRDSRQIPPRHVSKELLDRLDAYLAKLEPEMSPLPPTTIALPSQSPNSFSTDDMTLVRQVAVIFNVSDAQLTKDVQALKKFCSEKAALRDLKTCISLTNATNAAGEPTVSGGPKPFFPGRREDFTSDEAYSMWRKAELDTAQQLILALAAANRDALKDGPATPNPARPELSSRPSSLYVQGTGQEPGSPSKQLAHRHTPSLGSSTSSPYFATRPQTPIPIDEEAEELDESTFFLNATAEFPAKGYNFTFIPSAPRIYYRNLLAICLDYDISSLQDLRPEDEVSLRILSKENRDLLTECSIRWRLLPVTRAIDFLDEIGKRYASDEVPLIQCVVEALQDIDQICNGQYNDLMIADQDQMQASLSEIFDNLLRRMFDAVKSPKTFSSDLLATLLTTLDTIHVHPMFQETARNLPERLDEWAEAVRMVAAYQYDRERRSLTGESLPENHLVYLGSICQLLGWLKAMILDLDRVFRTPILGSVDVASTYLQLCAPLYIEDFYSASNLVAELLESGTPDDAAQREGAIRQLFESGRELVELAQAFCPDNPVFIDFSFFEPYVHRWMIATDAKTQQWVTSAIAVDTFQPEGEDHHSSSIVDLIESCKGAVSFVTALQWPDPIVNALFLTRMSQIVSKSIEEYCNQLERLFMEEMFPDHDRVDPEKDERTSAWLVRAKGIYQTDKKISPFSFEEKTLVKLNNIQAARDLLDKMYTAMNADEVSNLIEQQPTAAPSRNLFTIKVVLGEDLVPRDNTTKLNPFLTLSDSAGHRRAKTRTLYDTRNPRWAQNFDLSVDDSLWLAATVYHRNLVDKHDMLGRALFQLDPAKYSDFLPHELWLDLNTHGRLLVRVSMEGEKDDIQFYFGRAFRSLKRTESDMVRNIVDKMSPMIRYYLSKSTVKSLIRKGGFTFDLEGLKDLKINDKLKDIKLDKLRTMFSSSASTGNFEIPPLESEKLSKSASGPITNRRKGSGITDSEIEDAIGLLFEYFEETFALLKETLNETAFRIVMGKIWKEILTVLEGLLIPPLSSAPSDMRQFNDKEVYIVVRWLKGLSNFFYAGGEGVPVEDLHSATFKNLLALPLFYDLPTDDLMMECNRAINGMLTNSGNTLNRSMTRSKSVYQQRNLGTIRQRKRDKRQEQEAGNPEMMMRILRMRPNTSEFLAQMLETLEKIQQEQSSPPTRRQPTHVATRGRGRGRSRAANGFLPPLPGGALAA